MVPSDWEVLTFNSLLNTGDIEAIQDGNHGNSHPKSSDFVNEGIPFVMARDLKKGSVNLSSCAYITKKQADSLRIGFAKPGDILLSHKGTIGQVAKVQNCEHYMMLTPQVTYYRIARNSKLLADYLYQFFLSHEFQGRLKNLASQSTRSYLGITAQKKLSIQLPPLPEQQKIAKILTTWDKAINTTERLIENSKQQKKALMQQLLTGQKRLLDDSGQRFSGDWKYLRLDKVCTKITDGAHHSPKSVDENGYPMYSVKDMSPNGFKKNTARHISKEDYEYLCNQNCRPEVNDILIAKDGSILKHCFVLKAKTDGVILSSIALLRPNTNLVFPEFIAQYFSQEYVKFYVGRALTSGSGVPRIILKDFKGIKIQYPSLEEQQKIATVLTTADREIEVLEQQLVDLQQEKKALMQQLLTGKKRVKVA